MTVCCVRVRAASRSDFQRHSAFYETSVSDAVTSATWERVLAPASSMHALVAADRSNGEVAGFANYVVHPFTWSDLPACYLENLFVRPEARGSGAGVALLQHLIALGRTRR